MYNHSVGESNFLTETIIIDCNDPVTPFLTKHLISKCSYSYCLEKKLQHFPNERISIIL